jgi:hypothetical protein
VGQLSSEALDDCTQFPPGLWLVTTPDASAISFPSKQSTKRESDADITSKTPIINTGTNFTPEIEFRQQRKYMGI